jgi:hypothetical protein
VVQSVQSRTGGNSWHKLHNSPAAEQETDDDDDDEGWRDDGLDSFTCEGAFESPSDCLVLAIASWTKRKERISSKFFRQSVITKGALHSGQVVV